MSVTKINRVLTIYVKKILFILDFIMTEKELGSRPGEAQSQSGCILPWCLVKRSWRVQRVAEAAGAPLFDASVSAMRGVPSGAPPCAWARAALPPSMSRLSPSPLGGLHYSSIGEEWDCWQGHVETTLINICK